jgi:hypothetical protein
MKKVLVLVVCLMLVATTAVVMAGKDKPGKSGKAGQSTTAQLYLYEQNETGDWVLDGAWGKMTYTTAGPMFDFTFNGKGLEPGGEYTLDFASIALGTGTANKGGNVNIAGSVDPAADVTGDITLVDNNGVVVVLYGWESIIFDDTDV